jgi:MYXO-CTERM domain-containing protein
MISRAHFMRAVLTAVAAVAVLSTSREAAAQTCTNDVDCPNTACGGQVCDWNKGKTCQPAGGAATGLDGWCTTDSDCKCRGMGATCNVVYCTFTMPPDAGGAGGGSTGGSSGGATGGTTGATDAGTTSSGGGGGCSTAGPSSPSWTGVASALGALAALLALRRRREHHV